MKAKKRVPLYFRYRNCDAFAEYLHKQSLQGWHFSGFRFGMIFEAGLSQERFYDVEVFPNGAETDLKPDREVEEYTVYCEAVGWKFIDSIHKFCIFEKISDDAAAIVTPQERFRHIYGAEWKLWIRQFGICIIQFFIFLCNILWNRYGLFQNIMVCLFLLCGVLVIKKLTGGVILFINMCSRKHQLDNGSIPNYRGKNRYGMVMDIITACIILYVVVDYAYRYDDQTLFLYLVLLLGAVLVIQAAFAYFRPGRDVRLFLQTAAACCLPILILPTILMTGPGSYGLNESHEYEELLKQMPFTLDQMKQPQGEMIFADYGSSESILGEMTFCNMEYENESIVYHIYTSPYLWVTDRVWKNERRNINSSYEPCAQEWGAQEGYAGQGNYILRYKDTVIDIMANHPFHRKQIQKIREKLGVL